jgi:hypothetical protein
MVPTLTKTPPAPRWMQRHPAYYVVPENYWKQRACYGLPHPAAGEIAQADFTEFLRANLLVGSQSCPLAIARGRQRDHARRRRQREFDTENPFRLHSTLHRQLLLRLCRDGVGGHMFRRHGEKRTAPSKYWRRRRPIDLIGGKALGVVSV